LINCPFSGFYHGNWFSGQIEFSPQITKFSLNALRDPKFIFQQFGFRGQYSSPETKSGRKPFSWKRSWFRFAVSMKLR
jgi:hypothetical protein